jgi:hypothetical protein
MPSLKLISTTMGQSLGCRDAQKYGRVALDNVSKENELKGRCTHEWYLSLSTLKSFNTQVFHHPTSSIRHGSQ